MSEDTNNNLISVIVPVYNSEKYLYQCIDSIMSQTYSNFELILVDDGSPDNCGLICDEYAAKDSRVKVIHQNNAGQSAARNAAIEQAKGEWFHFVDSDDLIHPQMLEILYNAAQKENTDIVVCNSFSGNKISDNFFDMQVLNSKVLEIDELSLIDLFHSKDNYYWIVCAKLIKRSVVVSNLFTEGKIFEDNAVVCKWLYDAKRITICENILYYYRQGNESTTRSEFNLKKLDYLWALGEQILFYRKIEYKILFDCIVNIYLNFAISAIHKLQYKEENHLRNSIFYFVIRNKLFFNLNSIHKKTFLSICFPNSYKIYSFIKAKITGK